MRLSESLYVRRVVVEAAVGYSNAAFLGERRGPTQVIQPTGDLQLAAQEWKPLLGFSRFDVTVRNASRTTAWLDIRFAITYADALGVPVATREVVVKQIIQPGHTRSWSDIADDRVPERAVSARIAVISAERVVRAGEIY